MKNCSFLLLLFLFLSSCHSKKELLRLNLIKGETYISVTNMLAQVSQTINNQPVNMVMNIRGQMNYKVTGIRDSLYDMEVAYENLSMKISTSQGVVDYSSEKNDESDIFSSLLKLIKKRPFQVVMSNTGRIEAITNIESIFEGLFDTFPNLDEARKQQAKAQLMQAFGEKAFKGSFEMLSAIFPKEPVSKGDSWNARTQLESGMSATMLTSYSLRELKSSFAVIEGNSTIETADKDAYVQANGMPVKYDLKGKMVSTIKLNRSTGWITYARVEQHIEGNAFIKENPQIPEGMVIPMSMKNEMTISE